MSKMNVDEISDRAGTGAPNFPNGLSIDNSEVIPLAEAVWETGTSTTETIVSPEKIAAAIQARNNILAFCSFDGTSSTPISVQANGFNVTNVTKNGTGDYTINFTNNLPHTNYSLLGVCVQTSTDSNLVVSYHSSSSRQVGSVRIVLENRSGGLNDSAVVSITIIG